MVTMATTSISLLQCLSPFVTRLFDRFGGRSLLPLLQVFLQLLGSVQVVGTLGPDALLGSFSLRLICRTRTRTRTTTLRAALQQTTEPTQSAGEQVSHI